MSPSQDLADRAAAGHRAFFTELQAAVGQGWHEDHEGFSASVTGLAAPPFNGISVYGEHDREDLADALERVAASGFPYALQARERTVAAVRPHAERLRMEPSATMPLMVTTTAPAAIEVRGLTIRETGPLEGEHHAIVAAESFQAPVELMAELTRPELLDRRGVHVLVGFRRSHAVATAFVHVPIDIPAAGIIDVGTLEAHRGRGYAAAVTAATARVAFADGAELCYLLSTPMGLGVYERLGFRALETWTSWVGFPRLRS